MPTFYTKGLKLKSSQSNFSTGFLSCKIDGRSRWTGISITDAGRQCMECLFDRMEYSGRVCCRKKKKKKRKKDHKTNNFWTVNFCLVKKRQSYRASDVELFMEGKDTFTKQNKNIGMHSMPELLFLS